MAFLVFFALIAEAGPARATVITYVNPAVAITLGVLLLDEPLTIGMAIGFPLVIVGSVLATSRRDVPPAEETTLPAQATALPAAATGLTAEATALPAEAYPARPTWGGHRGDRGPSAPHRRQRRPDGMGPAGRR